MLHKIHFSSNRSFTSCSPLGDVYDLLIYCQPFFDKINLKEDRIQLILPEFMDFMNDYKQHWEDLLGNIHIYFIMMIRCLNSQGKNSYLYFAELLCVGEMRDVTGCPYCQKLCDKCWRLAITGSGIIFADIHFFAQDLPIDHSHFTWFK